MFFFEAHFRDGSFIQQKPDDQSLTTPGKNAFFDVLARIDDVLVFGLFSNGYAETVACVYLQDGHFEINGIPFTTQDPRVDLTGAKLRLIYFKRHHHTVTSGQEIHDIEYHIGWQTTINGQNYQQTIAIR